MKKNRMMRCASGLLVAVLLTTSMIAGTFAKYTTQDSGSDMARVAKWGVELQVGGDLYGEDYTATTGDIVGTDKLTVSSSSDGENVVAPGTKCEKGLDFSLNGAPEVSGTVTTTIEYENIYLMSGTYGVAVKADGVTADNFSGWGTLYVKSDESYEKATEYSENCAETYYTIEDVVTLANRYYPVEYQMKGTGLTYNLEYTETNNVDTLAGIVSTIGYGGTNPKTEIAAGKTTVTWTEEFTPNTVLEDVMNLDAQEILWKWDFCQGETECDDGDGACDSCKADTILGNLMVGDVAVVKSTDNGASFSEPKAADGTALNDYNLETSFSIDITVTQVD